MLHFTQNQRINPLDVQIYGHGSLSCCVSEENLHLAENRTQVSQPLDSHSTIPTSHLSYKSHWNESALVTRIVLACLQNKLMAGEIRAFCTIRWSRVRLCVVQCYHAGKKYVYNEWWRCVHMYWIAAIDSVNSVKWKLFYRHCLFCEQADELITRPTNDWVRSILTRASRLKGLIQGNVSIR